jgi:putative ABC transport system permease protein
MLAMVRLLGLRKLGIHKLRSLLTIVAVACGVGGTVAAALLYEAFVATYESAIRAVADGADLQVANGDVGVPEEVLDGVRAVPGVAAADPVVRGWITARGMPERFHVLGLDLTADRPTIGARPAQTVIDDPLVFVSDPQSLAVTTAGAERHHWRLGDEIEVRGPTGRRALTVRAVFEPTQWAARALGAQLLVMDLPAAQRLLGMEGRLSHVDLRLAPGTASADLEARLEAALGGRARLVHPAASGEVMRRLLGGYRYALAVGAGLCLVVAFYVVVNVMIISVAERRRELELLRLVGMTGRQLHALVAGHAMLLALLGCAAGAVLGVRAAQSLAATGGRSISLLYLEIGEPTVRVDLTAIVLALASALGIASVAAFAAVRDVTRRRARAPLSGGPAGGARARRCTIGAGAALLGAALVSWAVGDRLVTPRPLPVAATLLGALAGVALLVPALIGTVVRKADVPLERWLGGVGLLAARTIAAEIGRVMIAASGLMASLAGVLAFAALVASLDRSLAAGLRSTLSNVDLVVTSGGDAVSGHATPIAPATVAAIGAVRGVAYVDPIAARKIPYEGLVAALVASDARLLLDGRRDLQLAGADRASALARLAAGEAVLVTDSFTRRFARGVGDAITLATPSGALTLPIAGIYLFEPSVGDFGTIRLDRRLYERWWSDRAATAVHVTLAAGAEPASVARRIRRRVGGEGDLFAVTTGELRERYHAVLDRLGALLAPMVAVACVVGTLGLLAGRVAAVEGRRRLFGVLRMVGATRRQCAAVLMTEATLVGVLVAVAASLAGSALGYLEVRVILRDACGIDVPYANPSAVMASVLAAATLIGSASGYAQARLVTPVAGLEGAARA